MRWLPALLLSGFLAQGVAYAAEREVLVVDYDWLVDFGVANPDKRIGGCYTDPDGRVVEIMPVRPENWTKLCGPNQTIRVKTEEITECCEEDENGDCVSVRQCKIDVADCYAPNHGGHYQSHSVPYECTECSSVSATDDAIPIIETP